MAKPFLVPINMNKLEIQNAVIQNLAADPSSPVEGQRYYNTVSKKLRIYNGTTWDEYSTGAGVGDVTQASNSGGAGRLKISAGANKVIQDYAIAGIVKSDGSGVASAAVAGTDYLTGSSSNALTNKTFDANGTGNAITNIETADFAANVIDTDTTLAANSDTRIASQKAVKAYVDAASQAIKWKDAVRVATNAALPANTRSTNTLTANSNGLLNSTGIDGITNLAVNDRVLVKDEGTGANNGIYIITSVGAAGSPWTMLRATDADTSAEILNATVTVQEGTANADTAWKLTNDTVTLNTTALTFTNFISANVPVASTTVVGKVELATQAETEAKSSSSLAVTPASLATFTRKVIATIGDGSTTAIVVTDNLGTNDKIAIIRYASDNTEPECDITYGTNTTTFTFGVAPASNAFKVVIIG